ncbi:MAG: hypothetical protein GY829_04850 [Gammaproteobacteria bacterium]|nr:hypothetical protein [Gammaproteobacteria bacterium]
MKITELVEKRRLLAGFVRESIIIVIPLIQMVFSSAPQYTKNMGTG